jgi:hypothetical protein
MEQLFTIDITPAYTEIGRRAANVFRYGPGETTLETGVTITRDR